MRARALSLLSNAWPALSSALVVSSWPAMPVVPLLLSLLSLPLLDGCTRSGVDGGHAKQGDRDRKRLVIGITQEPDTLWMPMKQMNAAEHIGRTGTLSLTVFDDEWRLLPWAAQRIPTVDDGDVQIDEHGRMRVTWRLRDGLSWADGVPVTSRDWAFTWRLTNDPALEIVDRTAAERVLDMETPDDDTLVVVWKERYAYYAAYRQHEVLPQHIVEPLWRRAQAAGEPGALKEHPFGRTPVLGGAFTITEWSPGAYVVAKRNPFAVAFRPQLDEVIWKIVPSSTALESSLLAGNIDAVGVIGLAFDQAIELRARHGDRFDVHITDALLLEQLMLNLDNPLLADVRVREALLWSADRAGVVRTIFHDELAVADCNEPPRSPFFTNKTVARPFDLDKARALLDAAGFAPGPDGIRVRSSDNARLSLVLSSTAGDKTRELVEQILQASWRQAGIEVVIANQPAKMLFGDTIRHRKFPGMVMVAWSRDPLQITEANWRCDQVPRVDNGQRGQNYSGYCNPQVDGLLAAMSTELDDERRAALGQQVEQILSVDLPVLPLYFRKEVSVSPKGFVGWRPTGLLESLAWNAHEWQFAERSAANISTSRARTSEHDVADAADPDAGGAP